MSNVSRRPVSRLLPVGFALLALLAATAACGGPGGGGSGGGGSSESPVRPLSKADGWRDGLVDHLQDGPPLGLLEVASDRRTAERAWQENAPADLPRRDGDPEQPGRYGDLDSVDFSTHVVVVWSSGQSGSCPGWLSDVRTDGDTVEVKTARQAADACTDDYNPYRMVLAVDSDRLPDPGTLPTSDVVVDGRATGARSIVDTYPAGG